MVQHALQSIRNLQSDNWHLAFIDDGSRKPGRPIVEQILPDKLDQISFYNTEDTIDAKIRQGGSKIGLIMNEVTQIHADPEHPQYCEMAVMLCDDDALYPDYLINLSQWAQDNPDSHYTYSHVILFDPETEDPQQLPETPIVRSEYGRDIKFDRRRNKFNKTQELYPEAKLDASQVAWRTYCSKKAHFPTPRTCHLDSGFYKQLGTYYGRVRFSGFFSQYKGMHGDTLSIRDAATINNRKMRNKIYKVQDLDNT